MPLTLTLVERCSASNKRSNIWTVQGPTSYTTLGEALTPASLGLHQVSHVDVDIVSNSTPAIRAVSYDYTNSKLRFFDQAFAEIAATTDLSGFSGRLRATGV